MDKIKEIFYKIKTHFFEKIKNILKTDNEQYFDILMSKEVFGELRRKYKDVYLKNGNHCISSGFECWMSEKGNDEYGDEITLLSLLWKYYENCNTLSVCKNIRDYVDDDVFNIINDIVHANETIHENHN